MAASSTAHCRTILRLTVPLPAEFSVKAPCISGFVFMGCDLSAVRKRLRVMRRFHLARATILAHVAGFGKAVVSFLGLRTRGGGFDIRPQAVKGPGKNRGLRCFRDRVIQIFHIIEILSLFV